MSRALFLMNGAATRAWRGWLNEPSDETASNNWRHGKLQPDVRGEEAVRRLGQKGNGRREALGAARQGCRAAGTVSKAIGGRR